MQAATKEEIAASLDREIRRVVERSVSDILNTYEINNVAELLFEPGASREIDRQLQKISEPLVASDKQEAIEDIQDVINDIQDFTIAAALSQCSDQKMPCILVGSLAVPLLPNGPEYLDLLRGITSLIGKRSDIGSSDVARTFLRALTQGDSEYLWIAREEAESSFFSKLCDFVRLRVFGLSDSSYQRMSPGLFPPPPDNYGDGQWWNVETASKELSIYCCGTHAARRTPTYLNAKTTPLGVFLRFGAWHLGTRKQGKHIWDESAIEVPSWTPTYKNLDW